MDKTAREAGEETGNSDMRRVPARLQPVKPAKIRRMADFPGKERAQGGFPVKDFLDQGAVVLSYPGCPASLSLSAAWTICPESIGYLPGSGRGHLQA